MIIELKHMMGMQYWNADATSLAKQLVKILITEVIQVTYQISGNVI